MKVSDLIIYIMKIIWRDLRKIRSSRFRDIQKSPKSPNFEWGCTYTGSFQDRKNENAPKFPDICKRLDFLVFSDNDNKP